MFFNWVIFVDRGVGFRRTRRTCLAPALMLATFEEKKKCLGAQIFFFFFYAMNGRGPLRCGPYEFQKIPTLAKRRRNRSR